MGKTLRRYLIGEIGGAFLAGVGIFTFILLVARILDLVDLVMARGVPITQVLVLFGYILPSFLEVTIPMALLLGIVIAFGRLATDGELVALRAAGLHLFQLLRPVAMFGLFVGFLTLTLSISTRPWAHREIKEALYEIAKTRATAALRPRVFNTDFSEMVIYVDSLDQTNGLMKGIMLSDERNNFRRNTVFASAGRLVSNEEDHSIYLRLLDGTSMSYHAGQESYDKTDFQSLEVTLDLESNVTPAKNEQLRPREMEWQALLATRREKNRTGDDPIEEDIEIHRKFVLAVAAIFLAAIGVPLGMQRSRAVRARGMAVSIAVILTYYLLLSGAITLVRRGALLPHIGMWLPNLILGIASAWMLYRAANDKPTLPSFSGWRRRLTGPSGVER